MIYVFDVDGTLTPSRGLMDPAFKDWFVSNIKNYCLVTGSDKPKTIEQVGQDIFDNAMFSFNCSGNDVYAKGEHIYTDDWTIPREAKNWLNEKLTQSRFVLRTGLHIEERPGMVNFSVVGRNATLGERKLYASWDEDNQERVSIAKQFVGMFPELEAKVGGETGIDIFKKGKDKSQILNFFTDEEFTFFGDRMDNEGNDYPLAKVILDKKLGKCYHITNWQHTWETLKTL